MLGHLSTVRVGSGAVVWGELEGIMIGQYGQDALQGKIKGVSIQWIKVWPAVGMCESRPSCEIRGRGRHPCTLRLSSALSVGVT